MSDSWDGKTIHPIIERPHEYHIERFDLHVEDDYLDLTLRKDKTLRRLRFLRPRRIVIEEGFPVPTSGMIILDIRDRQWDDLRVEVADFEASPGRVTFFAADVIDLDAAPADT